MGKRENFDLAIARAFDRWCGDPFQCGVNDCVLAIADIVNEVCGYDPAGEFRNRYTTRRGALRVARAYGGFDAAVEAMAARFNWPEISPDDALTGDIGICPPTTILIKHRPLWLTRCVDGSLAGEPTSMIARAWRL